MLYQFFTSNPSKQIGNPEKPGKGFSKWPYHPGNQNYFHDNVKPFLVSFSLFF
jgi:hypothetical protein